MELKNEKVEIVKFNKTQIVCPIINNEPYVLVKTIIDGIGLNYDTAIVSLKKNERLKSYHAEWHVRSSNFDERTCPTYGLNPYNHYTVLPVRKVAAWLYSIKSNSVKEPAKSLLIKFQERCDDVLFQYFFGRMEPEQTYFEEKKGLLAQKRAIDTKIKNLKVSLSETPEGKDLNQAEEELKQVKTKLQRLEQKQFGMIYTLFDQLPE